MASELSLAQRQALDRMISGSFAAIGAPPASIQPPPTVGAMYAGVIPKTPVPKTPTPAQLSYMHAVPDDSYRRPAPVPIDDPTIPFGSAYYPSAFDGRAAGTMLEQIGVASGGRPAWAIPLPPAAPNIPLPRSRPPYAPNTWNYMDGDLPPPPAPSAAPSPAPANPGLGNAVLGNGVMAPGIAPQGPPPPGIAPTVWAGDNPQQQGGPLNITVRGGKQPPPISSALKYTLANATAQHAAKAKQATATGTAGGYQYENGQKVGYAPIAVGRGNYTPTSGAAAYALSNLAGQQAAQQKQATATGQTGTTIYQNGQKVGNVGGGSSAAAYNAAVKKNNSKSGSTSSGQSKTASDGSSWAANW